jgi:prepilin-type N-terminal cleavage/methylation domain-containing protein
MRRFRHPDGHASRRTGFTLVELLVSLALIVFIMSILSYAFQEATALFRNMKSSGDMAEKLRGATTILRRDLSAYHFDDERKLSDPNFWTIDNGPPGAGYFRVWHGQPSILEGNDLDGLPSYRSTTHMLACTVRLTGNQRSDFLTGYAPSNSPLLATANYNLLGWPETRYQDTPNTYTSQKAEVAYFLRQQPDTANGTPLFTLYRRQWLALPSNTNGNGPAPIQPVVTFPQKDPNGNAYYLEISCKPNPANASTMYFNSLPDLAIPPRRYGMNNSQAGLPNGVDPVSGSPTYPLLAEEAAALTFTDPSGTSWPNAFPGGDALLTDVISFDVRLLIQGATQFQDLFQITSSGFPSNNLAFQAATGPRVFDTWYGQKSADGTYDYTSWATPGTYASIPIYQGTNGTIRVLAVQVTLRVWDLKTQQSRQVSFVQEL